VHLKRFIRVLQVDLSAHKVRIEEREDLLQYLGGVGVGMRLLEEQKASASQPLDPAQPIVFASGALASVYPAMTKVAACFVSPLTGELGESYAGGRMALAMMTANIDAIVVVGQSTNPVCICISSKDVKFIDARALWGNHSSHVERVLRGIDYPLGAKRSIIHIEEGGENLVSYACVTVDTYRHFGRLGLGAVFGSKLLKAIAIVGDGSTSIKKPGEYLRTYRMLYDKCVSTDLMAKYHDIGTAINVKPLSEIGGLPTDNLRFGSSRFASNLSGETFANEHLQRKMACAGCPVGCIHIGQVKRDFAEHGYEFEVISVPYDYELIYALGTFLGLSRAQDVLELIDEVERYGLDAMSTGVVLGWATEALEEGLLTHEETQAHLRFGYVKGYIDAIRMIAANATDFYRVLARGVQHASKVYGGEDFAMHIAGNEMPGYHTGYGSLIGAAVGARHSHLDNAGYSLDQSGFAEKAEPEELAKALFEEELERCMLNALGMCLFSRKIYDRDTILKALSALGAEMTNDHLTEFAQRILNTKQRIKRDLGFSMTDIRFPKRFFETTSAKGLLDPAVGQRVIEAYSNLLTQNEEVRS